jgi:hypothetical protein
MPTRNRVFVSCAVLFLVSTLSRDLWPRLFQKDQEDARKLLYDLHFWIGNGPVLSLESSSPTPYFQGLIGLYLFFGYYFCPIPYFKLLVGPFLESSQDEYGTAAYKTVECDDSKVTLPSGLGLG